jgi:hemolysin III
MDWKQELQHEVEVVERISEEIANSITHGIGLALAAVAAAALMIQAVGQGDVWFIASCAIYAVTLVALYAASTLSHVFHSSRLRTLFRILDQACIYLLIAGTFTPFALVYLRHGWWLLLFAVMWAIALAGFFSKVLWAHRIEAVSTSIYLALGWLPVTSVRTILQLVPAACLWWMLAGGLCYTVGTIFLALDRKVPFFHATWHLLVIAGSACHFIGIYGYLSPAGG